MRTPRLRISSLIVLVVFCAVAFAALRHASPLVDSLTFALTLIALGLATLRAWHGRDEARARSGGFALAGLAYLLATLTPNVEPRLPTSLALAEVEARLPVPAQTVDPNTTYSLLVSSMNNVNWSRANSYPNANLVTSLAFSPDGGTLAVETAPALGGFVKRVVGEWPAQRESLRKIGHTVGLWVVAWSGGAISAGAFLRRRSRAWPL